ncbi:MAG: hypothetical protein FWC36_01690 [Spirochaetes bacterium]|nr:hypothetical protein [Spirochaetota bacterium]
MNTAIINKLKEGSIKNVILFGDSETIPSLPYVVLKPEPSEEHDKQNFRITVHRNQGESALAEAYIFTELPGLFNRVWLETGNSGKFRLMNSGEWFGPLPPNDDGTIAAGTIAYERIFFAPRLI